MQIPSLLSDRRRVMKYIHVKTGAVIETEAKIKGEFWVPEKKEKQAQAKGKKK